MSQDGVPGGRTPHPPRTVIPQWGVSVPPTRIDPRPSLTRPASNIAARPARSLRHLGRGITVWAGWGEGNVGGSAFGPCGWGSLVPGTREGRGYGRASWGRGSLERVGAAVTSRPIAPPGCAPCSSLAPRKGRPGVGGTLSAGHRTVGALTQPGGVGPALPPGLGDHAPWSAPAGVHVLSGCA